VYLRGFSDNCEGFILFVLERFALEDHIQEKARSTVIKDITTPKKANRNIG
jgi:hypothetical protein